MIDMALNAWGVVDAPLYGFLAGYLLLPRPEWANKVFSWLGSKMGG